MVHTLAFGLLSGYSPVQRIVTASQLPPPYPDARCFQRSGSVRVLLPCIPLHRASYVLLDCLLPTRVAALSSFAHPRSRSPPTRRLRAQRPHKHHQQHQFCPYSQDSRTSTNAYLAFLSCPSRAPAKIWLDSPVHHRLRYPLPIAGAPCPGYVNPLYLRPSPPPSLRTRPAVQHDVSRDRTRQITGHVYTTPATRGATVIPVPVTSTRANSTAAMSREESLRRPSLRRSRVRHRAVTISQHSPRIETLCSLAGSRSTEVWVGMKQRLARRHPMEWVGGGVHIVYHELSTDPIHVLPTHSPSSACPLSYIRYHLRMGAPHVCPGTGHSTMSHDGFGGLLVRQGSLPAPVPPLLSTWAVAYIPWSTFHCVRSTTWILYSIL